MMFFKVSPSPFFLGFFLPTVDTDASATSHGKPVLTSFITPLGSKKKKAWAEAENFHIDPESLGIQPF